MMKNMKFLFAIFILILGVFWKVDTVLANEDFVSAAPFQLDIQPVNFLQSGKWTYQFVWSRNSSNAQGAAFVTLASDPKVVLLKVDPAQRSNMGNPATVSLSPSTDYVFSYYSLPGCTKDDIDCEVIFSQEFTTKSPSTVSGTRTGYAGDASSEEIFAGLQAQINQLLEMIRQLRAALAAFTVGDQGGGDTFSDSRNSLTITTLSPLPSGKVAKAYSQKIDLSGLSGSDVISLSLASGNLPPGLNISTSCSSATSSCVGIYGTPNISKEEIDAVDGEYTFTIRVTQGSRSATKQFTLVISPASGNIPIITSVSPTSSIRPSFITPIAINILGTGFLGGIKPEVHLISPAGKITQMSVAAVVSTTIFALTYDNSIPVGNYQLEVTLGNTTSNRVPFVVTDGSHTSDTTGISISTSDSLAVAKNKYSKISFKATSPGPTSGDLYPQIEFSQTGSVPGMRFEPYPCNISGTTCPQVASVDTLFLDGVPTTIGTFPITITARDQYGKTGSNNFTVVVADDVSVGLNNINITSPRSGESWAVGSTHDITWDKTGIETRQLEISLEKNGTSIGSIGTAMGSAGKFTWTISSDRYVNVGAGKYKIVITSPADLSSGVCTNSIPPNCTYESALRGTSGEFDITTNVASGAKSLNITSPTDGEKWAMGSSHDIIWDKKGIDAGINLDIVLEQNGSLVANLGTVPVGAGKFTWSVTSTVNRYNGTATLSPGVYDLFVSNLNYCTNASSSNCTPYYVKGVKTLEITASTSGQKGVSITTTDSLTLAKDRAGQIAFKVVSSPASGDLVPDFTFSQNGNVPGMTFSRGPSSNSYTPDTLYLKGIPTTPGSYPLSITATDQYGNSGSRSFTVVVLVPGSTNVSDSDNSPDYSVSANNPVVTTFNYLNYPDLFIKGTTSDGVNTYVDSCNSSTGLNEGFIQRNNNSLRIAGISAQGFTCNNGVLVPPAGNTAGPHLDSLSRTSGAIGTTVVITGTGFTATGNLVNFGTTQLGPVSLVGGTLSFVVPNSATPNQVVPISVVTGNGVRSINSINFTTSSSGIIISEVPVVVSNIQPKSGHTGITMLISGSGFSATSSENVVKLTNKSSGVVTTVAAPNVTVQNIYNLLVYLPYTGIDPSSCVNLSGGCATTFAQPTVLPTGDYSVTVTVGNITSAPQTFTYLP